MLGRDSPLLMGVTAITAYCPPTSLQSIRNPQRSFCKWVFSGLPAETPEEAQAHTALAGSLGRNRREICAAALLPASGPRSLGSSRRPALGLRLLGAMARPLQLPLAGGGGRPPALVQSSYSWPLLLPGRSASTLNRPSRCPGLLGSGACLHRSTGTPVSSLCLS